MIAKSTKILIVDDFSLARIMLSEALNKLGMEDIVEAKDGQEAISVLENLFLVKKPIEFIFLDWTMPVMNGFEVLEKCRADERFANIPIVMVTAEIEQESVLKALAAGATDYIKKPISQDALVKKIEKGSWSPGWCRRAAGFR